MSVSWPLALPYSTVLSCLICEHVVIVFNICHFAFPTQPYHFGVPFVCAYRHMCMYKKHLIVVCIHVRISVFPTYPRLFFPFSFLLSFLPPACGHQALERQKEYFDCIRNERDELRDELADIKAKAKTGEVGLTTRGLGIVLYISII